MIREKVMRIISQIPSSVKVVAAAKTRTIEEIMEAIDAGISIVGENYVQEAESALSRIGSKVQWHMIGHLQSNKAKKAAQIFDMIQTVDSFKLASAVNRACHDLGKTMPVLIEVNSAKEPQKAGVMPENLIPLLMEIAELSNVRVMGLMTMGPVSQEPEEVRPFFRYTARLFDEIHKKGIPNIEMQCLSMGMSDTYKIAIEEGANLIRLGTCIFGERLYSSRMA
ncbi:MAG: YggS family pyridoxal phosphate-dependent enzyme [Desulfobacteraceae bacterium]|jgi:pyridoxal phosphate enzyme (YggS family)|nr:MAG: YggS family pyridoxal phosphate-dependent enzyme [Desulfobacteraceae bacterium]